MQIKRWASVALISAIAATTAAWAQPAQALVPDAFGFALYSGGVVSQEFPTGTTVLPTGVGRWNVTFPGIGVPQGVAHVTAVHDAVTNPPGRWCQAETWGVVGPDEVVKVACYSPGGVLDSTPGFSVLFARSSVTVIPPPSRYGYVHAAAGGGFFSAFNSSGGPVNVTNVGAGMYSVGFSGLATPGPRDGSFQVTAVNPAVGARCKIADWLSSANGQFARVFCFNPAGAFANTNFTLTYQFQRSLYGPAFPPGRFGYLWNQPPLGPPPTVFNSSGGAVALAAGPPVWTAQWASIGTPLGNTQVTAFGTTPDFCGLHQPWFNTVTGTLIARVNCFTNAGVPVNSGFFASHSSRF